MIENNEAALFAFQLSAMAKVVALSLANIASTRANTVKFVNDIRHLSIFGVPSLGENYILIC